MSFNNIHASFIVGDSSSYNDAAKSALLMALEQFKLLTTIMMNMIIVLIFYTVSVHLINCITL